jgi:hypothetical protein
MNANKLKGKIFEKGLNVAQTADLIDIHKSSLYRKLNGFDTFTVNEATQLKEILGLTNLEALDIFLSRSN